MSEPNTESNDFAVRQETELSDQPSKRSRRIRRAVIVSVVAHVVLVIGLLFWYVPTKQSASKAASATTAADQVTPAPPPPPPVTPQPAPDVPADQIQKSIESQIAEVQKLPDEHKLSQLEKNLKRLESISNPTSVNEVATKITSSLGLDPDQYAPKDKSTIPDGRFDADTAQMTDVSRTKNADGQWEYVTTLVDSVGHEMKVSMSAAEGETMYQTFEQMKKFPMAAGLYRSVVMPMMQKMMEAQDMAEQVAKEAERMNGE